MVIVVENGHNDSSSNSGQNCLLFTKYLQLWEGYESSYGLIVGQFGLFNLGWLDGEL